MKLNLALESRLHKLAKIAAAYSGISLNDYFTLAIKEEAAREMHLLGSIAQKANKAGGGKKDEN